MGLLSGVYIHAEKIIRHKKEGGDHFFPVVCSSVVTTESLRVEIYQIFIWKKCVNLLIAKFAFMEVA